MPQVILNNRLHDERIEFFNANGEYIGNTTNLLTFTDVRLQIARRKLTGFYLKFRGKKIEIDCNGNLKEWPNGLMDKNTNQLCELLNIKFEKC